MIRGVRKIAFSAMNWIVLLTLSAATAAVTAPAACHGTPTLISGSVQASPQLLASPSARNYPAGRVRRMGQAGEDFIFLASLPLPARKLCSAEVEIHVRRRTNGPSFEFNDFLLVGFAPFGSSGTRKVLFDGPIWAGDPPRISEKTARIPLPASELNTFVLLTPGPHFLDFVLHDDTAVDFVRLRVRFE